MSAIPEPNGWEDPLTGLEGPDFWQRVLVAEIARAGRYKRNLTVVVAELEGVLDMAETWGVEVGRHSIREAAQCLRRTSRTSDYCTRIGLTRFGVILTETDEIAAINYVERVRRACELWLESGAIALHLAIGWAGTEGDPTLTEVQRIATDRMYTELRRIGRRGGTDDTSDLIAS